MIRKQTKVEGEHVGKEENALNDHNDKKINRKHVTQRFFKVSSPPTTVFINLFIHQSIFPAPVTISLALKLLLKREKKRLRGKIP